MSGFPFAFGQPLFLLLFLLLPVFWWWSRGTLAGLSGPRRVTALSLRVLVYSLLVLALAELRFLKTNDQLAVIFVIDRSESIPAEKRDAARRYVVEEALRGRDAVREDVVGVVTFGKDAGIEWIPKPEDLILEGFSTLVDPEGTDIAAAVRLAVAAFPEGTGKRIVLLSDGNENRGDVLQEIREARSRGVTVDTVPINYAYDREVFVEKVLLPPAVNNDQPFDVRVVVHSSHETKARLRIFENDRLIERPDDVVELEPGKNVFDLPGLRIAQSGLYFYEARLEAIDRGDDSLLQNNTAYAFTAVEGEPRILLCTGQENEDVTLVEALRAENTRVDVVSADFLPSRAEAYLDYDAIFLSNVPAHQLSQETMELFEGLVQTIGMGFVMVGGENSFGAGGYQGTPVERLLPVEMDVKQRKVLPNGALCMVVHSCELGNGNLWAKRVIQKAIQILSPRDYAGVISYDMGQDRWLFPMWPVSRQREMLGLLNTFNPGDMMSFEGIMQLALKGLQATPASIKHMIVLSDGDPTMPSPGLVNQIVQSRITISTICYGSHGVDPIGMKGLARAGGGKFHYLQSPQNLPELFIREVMTVTKSLISEEPFQPGVASSSPILRGLTDGGIPRLDGYVITTPKPLSVVSLVHPPQAEDPTVDPVLATWTYGVGKAVAFTSDAGSRWGKQWASWANFQMFWQQCARWVMRSRSDNRFRLTRSVEGENAVVAIDAITQTGQFVNGLDFDARVLTPEFESVTSDARQVAPGRYEVAFPANKGGTYTVSLRYRDESGAVQNFTTGLNVPYSAEYQQLQTNHERLREAARLGGGRHFPDPADIDFFSRDFPANRDVRAIWRNLLIAAVLLFFADVFVRRVVVNYAAVTWGWATSLAATVTGRRREKGPADARLAVLLKKKAEIHAAREARFRPAASRRDAGEKHAEPVGGAKSWDATASRAVEGARPAAKPGAAVDGERSREERAGEGVEGGGATSYTTRLLEAKRRALGRDRKDGGE